MEAYEAPVMEVVVIDDDLYTNESSSSNVYDNVKPGREESL